MLEFFAIKFSKKLIVVSQEHKNLLLSIYGKKIGEKVFVLPNLLWKKEVLYSSNQVRSDKLLISFCYVGGATIWQNVEIIYMIVSYLYQELTGLGYKFSMKILAPERDHNYLMDIFNYLFKKIV